MGDKTAISWCDATWNYFRGCSRVSKGCEACYAEKVAHRFSGAGQPYEGLTRDGRWTGEVRAIPDKLDQPLRWKRPRRIFVASMSDPFHESIPDAQIDDMFAVMALADWHIFQLLTKRPERMRSYVSDSQRPFAILRAIDRVEVDRAMQDLDEEWKPLPSAPEYDVSNHGRVRRYDRTLAISEHSNGYGQVAISVNGKPKSRLIHALVLETFDRAAQPGEECAHRNGEKTDNRIANLRWASRTENMADASRHGTAGVWMKSRATLSDQEVSDIREARGRGEKLSVLAARYGTTNQQISAVALGKIFKPAPLKWPLPNVWLGVSAEDQETAAERIPLLIKTPAAVRFVSAEPLLAPIDLRIVERACPQCGHHTYQGVPGSSCPQCRTGSEDRFWVIVGGESGPRARACDAGWIGQIIRECRRSGVPCFVKQLGAKPYQTWDDVRHPVRLKHRAGAELAEWEPQFQVQEFPE